MTGLRAALLLLAAWLLAGPDAAHAGATVSYDSDPVEFSYSDFLAHADAHQLRDVTIRGAVAFGKTADKRRFTTYLPDDAQTVPRLLRDGVTVKAEADMADPILSFVLNLIPALLLMIVIVFFADYQRSRRSAPSDFGRARIKAPSPTLQRVTFDEVAGIDEARDELEEIVQFLREPERFRELGGRMPSGVLLSGPPGTGKTLLARALAGEAGVAFFTACGSDFIEMFVGVGASRMREAFARTRDHAPAILFIDEIDAIGRRRNGGHGAHDEEREQTLNQLLVEMDGIEGRGGVIVIGATNRPECLDPALLRPGRFDRQVAVPVPDLAGRERILAVHLKKVRAAAEIDVASLARGTPGMSGAELANLVNEAALLAARRGASEIGMAELDAARDKVMMGVERRSIAMSEDERRRTAYHEAGHALVALALPETGTLHKVTIVPRAQALGLTVLLPEGEPRGYAKAEMTAQIAMMFGGRVAEELIYGKDGVTTGAANDLKQATLLARRMVTEFGMSERLGRVSFADERAPVSKATADLIDAEIRRIAEAGEALAWSVLGAQRDALERTAAALLAQETLSGDEFRRLAGLG